eukprot:195267-Chlamydomonas_euryale.AAC.3
MSRACFSKKSGEATVDDWLHELIVEDRRRSEEHKDAKCFTLMTQCAPKQCTAISGQAYYGVSGGCARMWTHEVSDQGVSGAHRYGGWPRAVVRCRHAPTPL